MFEVRWQRWTANRPRLLEHTRFVADTTAVDSQLIEIRTGGRETVVDLTGEIAAFLRSAGARDGLLNVWVPHATAGLAVIETGAGSDTDLLAALHDLLPADDRWTHRHGRPGHG